MTLMQNDKRKKYKASRGGNPAFYISISIIVILAAVYFFIPSVNEWVKEAFEILTSDDQPRIRAWVSDFGFWGPVVLLVLMVVQMFLFVIPNVLLMMIAILSYGPVWGGLLAFFGIFCASSVGYRVGLSLGPYTIRRFVSLKLQNKLTEFINDYGFAAIAVTRLSSLSNDGLSFVVGLLRMGYVKFITATMIGITPLIVLLAIFGRNGKIEMGLLWIAVISLCLLIAYIIFDKRRKRKKAMEVTIKP